MERFFFDSVTILGLGFLALLSLIVLILLLIVVPGFFIWLALALIGKKRSLFKCGFANLVAFVASAFITTILSSIPLLILFSPLIFALIYLWVFKEILDLGWLHAIVAVLISVACVMVLTAIFSMIFSAIFKPPWLINFRF
ncbi:MAG: hypothetical protein NZ879_01645 [Archaeoglobaceae archaeon]|nr:hypothetical protein [Archaeoglobaceae archaeon]MDW8117666.1 hypothetical protein [Archaeoglobaceae archaeon]